MILRKAQKLQKIKCFFKIVFSCDFLYNVILDTLRIIKKYNYPQFSILFHFSFFKNISKISDFLFAKSGLRNFVLSMLNHSFSAKYGIFFLKITEWELA